VLAAAELQEVKLRRLARLTRKRLRTLSVSTKRPTARPFVAMFSHCSRACSPRSFTAGIFLFRTQLLSPRLRPALARVISATFRQLTNGGETPRRTPADILRADPSEHARRLCLRSGVHHEHRRLKYSSASTGSGKTTCGFPSRTTSGILFGSSHAGVREPPTNRPHARSIRHLHGKVLTAARAASSLRTMVSILPRRGSRLMVAVGSPSR